MKKSILVDGAIATKTWRNMVSRGLIFLFAVMPLVLLIVPAGVIWFLSLGHINLLGILDSCFSKLADKIFSGEVK